MLSKTPVNVLLIESNPADAAQIRASISDNAHHLFRVEWVATLDNALAYLSDKTLQEKTEVILFDLALTCTATAQEENISQALLIMDQLFQAAPCALIAVLGESNDDNVTQQIHRYGTYEYFNKTHLNSYWLPRILDYALERKKNELVLHDIEKTLHEEKARTGITLNAIDDAVLATDASGHLTYLNSAAENLTGWLQTDALGRPFTDIFNVLDSAKQSLNNPALCAINQAQTIELAANSILSRRDNSECVIEGSIIPLHDFAGHVTGTVTIFNDLGKSRAMAAEMAYLAQHDFLTGLPNRMLLTERLSQAIALANRNKTGIALLFIDLDFFKYINDSLGHAVGDQLLQSVAERLVSCVRATDTVARQGGDEFVILLTEIERPQDVTLTAEKLFLAFSEPHIIGTHELHVTLSIGISVYPDDGATADILMQNADAAMYHAKVIGRNNFQFFKMEMNANAMQRSFIEASLRRAIKQKEFVLHYQPKVDIASGTIIGAEALIRWQDPKHGMIYPSEFLAIAEECGLIVPIGGWVLREVCNQLRTWLKAGLRIIPVAINISTVELKHKYFLDGITQVLQETKIPPYYLELEFTETTLMRNAELSIAMLESLKSIGVQLAIDNFGTGYSSLSYLKRFPVDTLKIDPSFLRSIEEDDSDNITILSTIIAMGCNLKQRVLAEGVETARQFSFLRHQRCHEAQGSYVGQPLPADKFEQLLQANTLPALAARQHHDHHK